jgi:hypothetical protein
MRKAYVGVLVMVCSLSWPMARASAQALTLEQRVAAIEAKLKCVSVEGSNGTELIVTGCNVHIRNGSNFTYAKDGIPGVKEGTGNLIIGYNAPVSGQDRTGSHNLVIGDYHTYSSTGGLVAGVQNAITGQSASVTAAVSTSP